MLFRSDRAVRTAFVSQINAWLKNKGLYKKNESAITFADVQDCLVLVSSSFSTRTSYENQTKKAITNKFVAQAMTEFLKHQLEVYFIEHPDEAEKAAQLYDASRNTGNEVLDVVLTEKSLLCESQIGRAHV